MSILYDVHVKKQNNEVTFIVKLPNGNPAPKDTEVLKTAISEDEAKHIISQYPKATRPKC